MRRANIELHIRELLIDTPGRVNSDEISRGLQQELISLFGRDDLVARNPNVDLANSATRDTIEVEPQDRGDFIGAKLARAIFRELLK